MLGKNIIPLFYKQKAQPSFYSSAPSPTHLSLDALYTWITKKLNNSTTDVVNLVVQELESLLRVQAYRLPVWNTQNAIKE